MVSNKSQVCEICGKHAEVEPLGCKHYPVGVSVVKEVSVNPESLIRRLIRELRK